MSISIFTTYTEPEKRNDPWKEAIECYKDFSDEVIVKGQNWPKEFTWDLIGKTFQEGFEESTGDWAIRMDIDYFFHEKYKDILPKVLMKYNDYPGVVFPQYQFFTPDRFQVKTRLCLALNKKKYPNIKLNGGGDLCLATLNDTLLSINNLPNVNIPIYQYDSMFRTKEIISTDRARFARAWNRFFLDYGNRGGGTDKEAFDAWYQDIRIKYKKHTNKLRRQDHPKYMIEKISNIRSDQFGFDAFGLKDKTSRTINDYLKGKKNLYIDGKINNLKLDRVSFK